MQFKDVMVALLVVFLWSINLIIQKILCEEISLEFFNFMRFLCCTPFLLVLKKPPSIVFSKLLFVGIFWNVLNIFLVGLSLQAGTGAGVISVIFQTCSLFGILFCFLLVKEIPKTHQLIGMTLSFLGVVLLFHDSFTNNVGIMGLVFILLAAMSWGVGVSLIKKYNLSADFSTNVWLAVVSVLPMGGVTYLRGGSLLITNSVKVLSFKIMLGILFGAFGSILLAGCLWISLLKKYPSSLVTPFMLLLPLISCITSTLFLGEEFTTFQIFAFLIIFLGLLVNQNVLNLNLRSKVASLDL